MREYTRKLLISISFFFIFIAIIVAVLLVFFHISDFGGKPRIEVTNDIFLV